MEHMVTTPVQHIAEVIEMPKQLGKTQQRVLAVLGLLQSNRDEAYSYSTLMSETGTPYDQLLYMLHAWEAVGMVTKSEVAEGPGRPKVTFQWTARVGGTRKVSTG